MGCGAEILAAQAHQKLHDVDRRRVLDQAVNKDEGGVPPSYAQLPHQHVEGDADAQAPLQFA